MDPLNNARTVLPRTTKFGRITRVAEERILWGSHAPTARGCAPGLPNFSVSFLFMPITFCRRTNKFDVVTIGRGLIFRRQPRLPSQESGVPGLPNFLGFSCIYVYTLERRTTKFGMVTHMVRYVFLRG